MIPENILKAAADSYAQSKDDVVALADAIWAYQQLGLQNEASTLKRSWKYKRAYLRDFLNNPTPSMLY